MLLPVVEPVAEISSPGLCGINRPGNTVLGVVHLVHIQDWRRKPTSEGFGKYIYRNVLDPCTASETVKATVAETVVS
jgi:hypothetical protein